MLKAPSSSTPTLSKPTLAESKAALAGKAKGPEPSSIVSANTMPPLDQEKSKKNYRFAEAPFSDQMAFVFGGAAGEKAAKKIREDAEKKYPDPIQIPERKGYIEQKVTARAKDVDTRFYKGIGDVFQSLAHLKDPAQGDEAGKQQILGLMQKLGLNIDPDNMTTHFHPGPPRMLQVTWVNRPTENLKTPGSEINQLANCYQQNLNQTEQQSFQRDWGQHVKNANSGGPKIPPQDFLDRANDSFEENRQALMKPDQQHQQSKAPDPDHSTAQP